MRATQIERRRGDTYDVMITVVDGDDEIITLTTETFILSVSTKAEPTTSPDIMQSTGTILDAINGKVIFPITGTAAAGTYFYDIQMTDTAGKIRTIGFDTYTIKQDITK